MEAQSRGAGFGGVLVVVAVGGIGAGCVGAAMVWLLLRVQALTYGMDSESLLTEIRAASDARRVVGPAAGGVLAGLGWWWLRRRRPIATVERALTREPSVLPVGRTIADALLQILVVGSGASIGREGAPRQAAAALAHALSHRLRVPDEVRLAVVAAAAGAGLAAVYNVPLAGVAFTLEVLPVPRRWRTAAIALAMSAIATVTAWPVVTNRPTYAFPDLALTAATAGGAGGWALACIPLCAGLGIAFHRLARVAEARRTSPGWRLPVAVATASALVGLGSIVLPALPGNGKDQLQLAFSAEGSLRLFAALLVLKPLATALCLRSGAVGGHLTPALATGAALGGLAAVAIAPWTGASSVPVFALIAAGGVLAVTQRAPVFAAAMTWELTHAPAWTIPFLLITAVGAYRASLRMGAAKRGGVDREARI